MALLIVLIGSGDLRHYAISCLRALSSVVQVRELLHRIIVINFIGLRTRFAHNHVIIPVCNNYVFSGNSFGLLSSLHYCKGLIVQLS